MRPLALRPGLFYQRRMVTGGDTGYGGLLNVDHTVRGYEAAGAQAIQLEDQKFPKKCGHTPSRRVIPLADAARKIKVASEARSSKDFKIIARTDARTALGVDEALQRSWMPELRRQPIGGELALVDVSEQLFSLGQSNGPLLVHDERLALVLIVGNI
jgi:Phosphoenolpyruvate phosphomutase